MEKGREEVRIKVEREEGLFTDAEQDMLDSGFLTDNFIKSVSKNISSLLSPSDPESYNPCDKCSILAKTNTKQEKQIETIIESLRLGQQENAELKVKLKVFDIQMGEQAQEIDKLKKELALAKKRVVDRSSSPSSQAGREAASLKRRRSSSSVSPTTVSLSPTECLQQMCGPPLPPTQSAYPGGQPPSIGQTVYNDQLVSHGIDGSKRMHGYYCICGVQFPIEPLLYRHLKQVLTFRSVPLLQSQSSTPPHNPATYQRSVIVCCICQERFYDWFPFRAHTNKTHGIVDLERFEWNEQNMTKNICNTSSQNQSYS